MFLGLPDPDTIVRDTGSGSSCHQAKIARKTLIPTVCDFFYDILCLKNDVNAPLKSNKQKNFEKLFFVDVLKVTDENSRIRIRIY
jgi:hypothetical protein